MLAINFDQNLHLHLRQYITREYTYPHLTGITQTTTAGWFRTQQQDPSAYYILKSKTLTNAFLAKENLSCCLYKLLEGFTIVLPSFYRYNHSDIKKLKSFRYTNLKAILEAKYETLNNLPSLKNSQPEKVLVYENNCFLGLEAWRSYLLSTKKNHIIAAIKRYIIHQTDDTLYLSSYPTPSWKRDLQVIGLNPQITKLDNNICKVEL